MGGERGRIDVDVGRLLVEADIAVGVGERTLDERDVDRERQVAQVLLAGDGCDLGERALGRLVHAAALDAGVAEGAEANVGVEARPAGADLAEQLHGDAAGQHERLDLVVAGELLHAWRPNPVTADHLANEPFVGEAVHAPLLAVANSERMDHRQIAWMAGGEEAFLHRLVQRGCFDEAAAAADQRDGVAVLDYADGGLGGHELVDGHCGPQ